MILKCWIAEFGLESRFPPTSRALPPKIFRKPPIPTHSLNFPKIFTRRKKKVETKDYREGGEVGEVGRQLEPSKGFNDV